MENMMLMNILQPISLGLLIDPNPGEDIRYTNNSWCEKEDSKHFNVYLFIFNLHNHHTKSVLLFPSKNKEIETLRGWINCLNSHGWKETEWRRHEPRMFPYRDCTHKYDTLLLVLQTPRENERKLTWVTSKVLSDYSHD